jgi:hypothetical protein
MPESILAGALVSLLPAFALAGVMPDHRSGVPTAFSAIPTDAPEANAATALRVPVTSPRFRTEPDPYHMMAGRIDPVKEQVKPLGGILVNLRSPTPAPESRFLIQPMGHSQPQAKTNDKRMASATRVHIFWMFGGR